MIHGEEDKDRETEELWQELVLGVGRQRGPWREGTLQKCKW